MDFSVRDDNGGNGRVAHDVLADAAFRREPDAAGALTTTHYQISTLFVGDATDAFADVLHCLTSHLMLELFTNKLYTFQTAPSITYGPLLHHLIYTAILLITFTYLIAK